TSERNLTPSSVADGSAESVCPGVAGGLQIEQGQDVETRGTVFHDNTPPRRTNARMNLLSLPARLAISSPRLPSPIQESPHHRVEAVPGHERYMQMRYFCHCAKETHPRDLR